MTIEELKQQIGQQTGIPSHLLTGETGEEVIAQAKALIAYRKDSEAQRPKSTKEEFASWANAIEGNKEPDTGQMIAGLDELARVEAGGYPSIHDGGEPSGVNGLYTPEQAFSEFAAKSLSWNPNKERGWTRII